MSEDKKPDEEERTVFMPLADVPPAGAEAAGESEKTVPPVAAAPEPAAPDPAATATPRTGLTAANFTIRTDGQGIKVGDVLNHIFEVKRFLARGGMGEVFEGCNINSDERVAIKVMLPALAADEKVIAMFRKEARTLTRLQHEALVQYRVLAQEPNLGVLYIVTEFIDGVNLSDALGKISPSAEELAGLLRRLAGGLRAAHALGAIHRDISPDNVLLADGRLLGAKVIDFGIAKDLDASSATIVGDGFAGKLNYVAPEQLGDYGRDVGAWTDIYSLALVILAVALGKNVNLSGSLVDAIDKRRKGVDVSAAPESLRPVLEAMLRADPAQRLRSMDEVLAMLDRSGIVAAPGADVSHGPARSSSGGGGSSSAATTAGGGGVSKPVLIGGGVAALAVAAGLYFAFAGGGGEKSAQGGSGSPADAARAAIDSAIPSVACTWLDIGSVEASGGGVKVAMRGVAGNENNAQTELNQALTNAGVKNATIDFGDVAPITPAGCAALDTFRQTRETDVDRLTVPQPRFQLADQGGKQVATTSATINIGDPDLDFAIIGIEPSGAITMLIPDRAAFKQELDNSVNGKPVASDGEERYKLNVDVDHVGWSGYMLVTGKGPFDKNLVEPPIGARGPSWQQQFLSTAADRGWKTEMVWFESVKG